MSSAGAQSPFQVAEAGGRHAGFLRLRANRAAADLNRDAQGLRRRAADHLDKIRNRIRYNKASDDPAIQMKADAGRTRHLQREIDNFIQQAEICEELARRKAAGGP